MKTILFCFSALLLSVACYAGGGGKDKFAINMPYDSTTQKYTYKKVVEVPGKTAKDLYLLAKSWGKHKFMHEKFVIDEENTELADNGNFEVTVMMNAGMVKMPMKGTTLYNMNIQFKEGKARIVVTDLKVSDNASGTTNEKTMEIYSREADQMGGLMAAGKSAGKKFTADYMNAVDAEMVKVITDLETALKGGGAKDNW